MQYPLEWKETGNKTNLPVKQKIHIYFLLQVPLLSYMN